MPDDDLGQQTADEVEMQPAPERARRDAAAFAWFVAAGQEALGEYYLALLERYLPGAKLFIGMNHGSDPVWEERFRAAGLDAEVRWARPEIGDYWDATGFLTALEAFHESDEEFSLVWFGHTKGGSRPFADYVHVRSEQEGEFWARREEIHRFFADPEVGLFAPRFNLTPPYPFPGRGWTDELAALQRVYRERYAPLGLCALDTFFVLRGEVVRRFCETVGAEFFRTDPGAYGANKWFFEMAFPSIAAMQGYAPFIDREVAGEDDPRDDLMISRDVKQIHRLAAAEVERWRENPFAFLPRIVPWDRPAWRGMVVAERREIESRSREDEGGVRSDAPFAGTSADAESTAVESAREGSDSDDAAIALTPTILPPKPYPLPGLPLPGGGVSAGGGSLPSGTGEGLIGSEAIGRGATSTPTVVERRVESRGWVRSPETGAWQPVAGGPHDGLRIVLAEPVTTPFRARLTLTASGMEALRIVLWGEAAGGRWARNAWLDVGRPGALHHELRRVGLFVNPALRFFDLELEQTLEPGETLTEIVLSPADSEQRDATPVPAMAIDLHEVSIARDWPVGPPVRFVPDWRDGSRFPQRRADGRRDAVIFAWFVPPRMPELGEYYLNLLRYYHVDSKLFIGMNHGSDPVWEERFRAAGLDAEVRWARPEIGDYWDATGFLTALEAFHESDEDFALVWFGHTKGGSRGDFAEYEATRYALLRNFWSRRAEIEGIFGDPKIGIFAPRFSPLPMGFYGDELPALQRIYADEFAPLGLHAKETFYVLRADIARRFCGGIDPAVYRTPPGEYGAGRYFFEIGLPNIATMQGYEPFIDPDVPGEGDPREDAWLRHDPKQNHRISQVELERWRRDRTNFAPPRMRELMSAQEP